MGSFLSSFSPPSSSAYGAGDSSSSSSSRVQAFHSSTEWRNHVSSLKESSSSSVLMVIDFTATWCGPCKFMEPAFIDLSNKFTDVVFVKIDVDELQDIAQEFGVQAMPTFVLVKDGKQIDKVVGAKKDELHNKIKRHSTPAAI